MIKWLWRMIVGGCDHNWHIHRQGPITRSGLTVGFYYDLQCEKCGDIKTRNQK